MFVMNYKAINPETVVLVNHEMKKYLESEGFCVISKVGDKWAFEKSDDILNIIKSRKGGKTYYG